MSNLVVTVADLINDDGVAVVADRKEVEEGEEIDGSQPANAPLTGTYISRASGTGVPFKKITGPWSFTVSL
jgi:hypothetical protein